MAEASQKTRDFLRRTRWAIGADRRLYTLAGFYVLCVSAMLLGLHRDLIGSLTLYYSTWIVPAFDALVLYISARVLWRMWRERNAAEPRTALCQLGSVMTPQLLANALLYATITVFFGAFTGIKCSFPMFQSFWFDPYLSTWSRDLHQPIKIWNLLHALFGHPWSNAIVSAAYYGVWPVILTFSPLLAAFLKDRKLRERYLTAYLLAWILFGTVAALVFMSAGPIFYQRVTGDTQRFQAMHDYLHNQGMAWGPEYLWRVYKAGRIEAGGGISAFPSMHVTISVLATCLAWSIRRWAGIAMTAFTALIVMSSVYLGWHYALGDYVVVLSAWLLWRATALKPFRLLYPIQSVQTPRPA